MSVRRFAEGVGGDEGGRKGREVVSCEVAV